jgi:hypothetical protein
MRQGILFVVIFFLVFDLFGQAEKDNIVTSDIANFWMAYDKIIQTKDSAEQYGYLRQYFLEKGSVGLNAFRQARDYTAESYIRAINSYPMFWESIRSNTLKAADFSSEIEDEIAKLKNLYPDLKPAKLYFTIGALRSGGTTLNGMVLIGSEIALADSTAIVSEFPENIGRARIKFFATNPIEDVVLLNVHEYVHTQQKPIAYNLLYQCLYEGVAEFVSVLSTGKKSAAPAVHFGRENEEFVRQEFEKDIFLVHKQPYWLWSDLQNKFDMRDLGYYVGYAICERYYNQAKNKKQAIREMIGLDYTNDKQIERFVDGTKYFSASIRVLRHQFEKQQPYVVDISQFRNGSKSVNPNLTQITIHFSSPMDKSTRGFDYGPLGENNVLMVKNVIGYSEDGMSFTFEVELSPDKRFQSVMTDRFRSLKGLPLKPFLIDIKTAKL